jgi:uncharacterized cofD-like protein
MHTGTEAEVLLEELRMARQGPRVVAIGGGTGLARALEAIRGYAGVIDAVVTVADDGGSSGRLAPSLDIPPPGDIRKCLIALTPEDSVWRRLFEHRFTGADVEGHSLGNLIIAALAEIDGFRSPPLSSSCSGRWAGSRPRRSIFLAAMIDGRSVTGQVNISLARGMVDSTGSPDDAPATAPASALRRPTRS